MLILTQDKECLVNLDMINTISTYCHHSEDGIESYRILAWCDGEFDHVSSLGDYSTIDRCKEIIHKIYETYGSYLHIPGSPAILKGSCATPELIFNQPKYYEMPEE